MSEYRRYNLTLTVADPSAREKFRSLSRPESFFEIRPNREPGQRGAYSVEMTDEEYRRALRDAEDPGSNLIAVEPDQVGGPSLGGYADIPGGAALDYLAASGADPLGLTGRGATVAVLDSGLGAALRDGMFGGRIKAAKSFVLQDPYSSVGHDPLNDTHGHGSCMASLAVPPRARLVVAQTYYSAACIARGLYWAADEVGVHVANMSLYYGQGVSSRVVEDAINNARSKNVILFASAGNDGTSTPDYPAGHAGVYAISGYDAKTDAKVEGSNYGDHVWGASVWRPVVWATRTGAIEDAGATGGTSAACALAANLAARLVGGDHSPGNVIKYLAETARKTSAPFAHEGNGVLQLFAAANRIRRDKPKKKDLAGRTVDRMLRPVDEDGNLLDGTGPGTPPLRDGGDFATGVCRLQEEQGGAWKWPPTTG